MLINQEKISLLNQALGSAKIAISVDTETNYTDVYSDRFCLGISICIDGEDCYYIPVNHQKFGDWVPENIIVPEDLFSCVMVPIIFHNAKFDIHVLKKAGIIFSAITCSDIQDTMIMAHLIDENWFVALEELSKRILGNEGKRKELKNVLKAMGGKEMWTSFPPIYMCSYAETDAKLTYDLYFTLKSMLEAQDLWEVYRNDIHFMLILQKLEEDGLPVDLELCSTLEKRCESRMLDIRRELGFDPAKPSQLHPKLFGLPPLGLGLIPTSLTPKTRKPQVNDAYLQSVNHPIAGLVLEYRGLGKAMSSYYRAYQELADQAGILHATFKQTGTVTGRLACADPNLQQIPREGDVKGVFLPRSGFELWEIDYSNIEMRLAAVYAQEHAMLDIFKDRAGDIHGLVAQRLNIPRQKAKVVNFLIIYGGGKEVLATQLGITYQEAYSILQGYKREFKAIFDVMYSATEAAKKASYVKMWTGRRRHFTLYPDFHKAFNSIIQGGAMEIIKRSMIELSAQGYDMCNQVHDSVWVNVRDKEEVTSIQKLMESWTEEAFDLPFYTEAKRLK